MPIHDYILHADKPRHVTVRWRHGMKEIDLRVDGKSAARFDDKEMLGDGELFELEDGTRFELLPDSDGEELRLVQDEGVPQRYDYEARLQTWVRSVGIGAIAIGIVLTLIHFPELLSSFDGTAGDMTRPSRGVMRFVFGPLAPFVLAGCGTMVLSIPSIWSFLVLLLAIAINTFAILTGGLLVALLCCLLLFLWFKGLRSYGELQQRDDLRQMDELEANAKW
jgi:hypothetical protein